MAFDYIKVDRDKMPESYREFEVKDFDGQTKSLECYLVDYYIDTLGLLHHNDRVDEYHGDIHFYGWAEDGVTMQNYCARFTDGQLQWIKESE